jgi:hypothetical protein
MSVQKNSLDALLPFYGGDGRGKLFTVFNYRGTEFRLPLNSAANPESIEGSVLHNLMLNKNYDDASKSSGMKGSDSDNDMHNQFVDFVVRVAEFHRSIDSPVGVGSTVSEVEDELRRAADQALNTKASTLKRKIGGVFNIDQTAHAGKPTLRQDTGITNDATLFDYLNALMLSESKYIKPDDVRDATSLARAVPRPVFSDGSSNFGEELKTYVGDCDGSADGTLCLLTFWDPSNPKTSAGRAIKNLLGSNPENMKKVTDTLSTKLTDTLVNYAVAFYSAVAVVGDATADLKAKFSELKREDNGTRNDLRSNLVESLIRGATEAVKSAVGDVTSGSFTTLSVPAAYDLYTNVFARWGDLDPDVRAFYSQQVQLFRRHSMTASEWKVVEDPTSVSVTTLDRSLYRLNLVKSVAGAKDTRFEATLPFVPASVTGLWYTDASGMKQKIERGKYGANVLKVLYRAVYNGAVPQVSGSEGKASVSLNASGLPRLSKFDLNDSTLVRHVVLAKKQEQAKVSARASSSRPADGSFDDILQDMTSGLRYQRDSAGRLFREENGSKVYYDEDGDGVAKALAASSSCFTTGVGVKGDCDEVFRCLLSGDPTNLSKCLSMLRNRDMFQVAAEEFTKMEPNIARRILKTFGIRQGTEFNAELGRKIYVPETYDNWVAEVVNKSAENKLMSVEARDAILSNTGLASYLQGLLSMVRSNPAILNKDLVSGTKVSASEAVPDYLKQLGIQWFVSPVAQGSSAAVSLGADLLKSGIVMSPLEVKTPLPVPLALAMANVSVNKGNLFPMMAGGNPSLYKKRANDGMISNSEMLRNMFTVAFEEMARNGKELVEEDKERIYEAIGKVNKLEGQLLQFLDYMQVYNDLQAAMRANGSFTKEQEQLSLADLKRTSATAAYLLEASSDLEGCISRNVQSQSTLTSDLVGKVYKALTDAAVGKQNPVIAPVL